jgi:large subunit ribosomal protein L28
MAKRCKLTGKRRNVGYSVSHAHNRTKKVQLPNIQTKRLWLESQGRFIRVKLSTSALRTVTKKGLDRFLKDAGLSLRDIT